MPTICAVVLTYNRRDLLNGCLKAISSQTHQCNRIIVIDNASEDGTSELLHAQWKGRVDAHFLPENVGAAGGFAIGMHLGCQTGMDYIWVMDDDVVPEADALARLLAAVDLLADRNIVAPFVISTARSPAGQLTNVPEIDKRRNALSYENWPDLLEHSIVPITRATFVAILLPRGTIQRYGLPIPEMYIWGEDSEFTLRITRDHPAYLVGNSHVVHVRQLAGVLDIRTESSSKRISYHAHRIRNDIYIKRHYEGFRAVARYIRWQTCLIARFCIYGEFTKAAAVLRGVTQGLIFRPGIASMDAPFNIAGIRSTDPGLLRQRESRPLERRRDAAAGGVRTRPG
ncbi:glycosyltransferase [Siccirubricoccus deserti]|uniref:Glycosyltransferase n=1 Tax=Siccirubricoccus deserti TaxID=2013562 RepID=A0A9X0R6S3_9PROT|nr:glycosyltransferase [Siccirubricoccus deserti]MBC4019372.1 glycosyltransferase [Siccirubricoccus deserti]